MRFIIPLILAVFLASPACAEFVGPGGKSGAPAALKGGFHGPLSGAQAETVAGAKNLPDNAPVVLVGNIVSKVAGSKKKYIFRDSSGEIVLEISPKVFKGLDVTPADTVRVSGKLDQDFGEEPEVEVKELEALK